MGKRITRELERKHSANLQYEITPSHAEIEPFLRLRDARHRTPGFTYAAAIAWTEGGQERLITNRDAPVAAVLFRAPWDQHWSQLKGVWGVGHRVAVPDSGVDFADLFRWAMAKVKASGLCRLVIAYADVEAGDTGGVFRTYGFRYHGLRAPSVSGVDLQEGDRKPVRHVPGQKATGKYDTRSAPKIQKHVGDPAGSGVTVTKHRDDGKHFFWLPLNDDGLRLAEQIGLQHQPYGG